MIYDENGIAEKIMNGETVGKEQLIEMITLILNDELLLLDNVIKTINDNLCERGTIMVLKRDLYSLYDLLLKYLYENLQ
ncbi:MAG: hypothetical protein RR630_10445 [Coprobacillus sp.]